MDADRWKRVDRILQEALSRPPEVLAQFLAEACAGDEALRREVESLIEHERRADDIIDSHGLAAKEAEDFRDAHADLAGRTLLHYRIEARIGVGGMGVVYQAQDLKLGRRVAVKFLPEKLSRDGQRIGRLRREAKILASFSHPNIAGIYGLEEENGTHFLALELIDGKTLADRLKKGPIPVEEALDICMQIAEGLEAAHEKGIVHRDLKPANVKVTPGGKAKILDFGLAKVFRDPTASGEDHAPPIMSAEGTLPGVVLGTAPYMSPEQAQGKALNKQTDIWAFGCIMYECLTGRRAFPGDTISETVASILKSEPDLTVLPADTPASARSLVRRCLQKDPHIRLHDIADARVELTEIRLDRLVQERPSARIFPWGSFLIVAAGMMLGATVAGVVVWESLPPRPAPLVRSTLKIQSGQCLDGGRLRSERPTRTAVALSKDARFLVYSAAPFGTSAQGTPRIYLRRLDQTDATAVPGTEGGISPFLSPDDLWIGFWEGERLCKVRIGGGIPTSLCETAMPFGVEWGPDNTIVFSSEEGSGISRISADGGRLETLTEVDLAKDYGHRLPHWLPDGQGLLFTVMGDGIDFKPRVAVLDINTRQWKVVMDDAADGRLLPTGHMIFLRQGTLMAVGFDLEHRVPIGTPVPVVAAVMQALNIMNTFYNTAAGQITVSKSGWLVYVPGGIAPDSANALVRVDQEGKMESLADFAAPFAALRASPDGRRIAYKTAGREFQIWVYDINRGTASRVSGDGRVTTPAWTPDGERLVFGWCAVGPANLHWRAADGTAPPERLMTSSYEQYGGSFTPDGATMAFVEIRPGSGADILLMDAKNRSAVPFLNSKAQEESPTFSPDGRWLAYASDESGRMEVWVRPFPKAEARYQISKDGGFQPLWSPDGRRLYYRQGDEVWAADVRTEGRFSADRPRLLFSQRGLRSARPSNAWDVLPDGQHFLMIKGEESTPEPVREMILVQNWLEELKRLVPVK